MKKPKKKQQKKSAMSETKPEKKSGNSEKNKTEPKSFRDADITFIALKEPLSEEWFAECKSEMKPHKHARLALKALHQAGSNKKSVRKILPDISTAIDKISAAKEGKKAEWKNALWRFVAKFSQLDVVDLVKSFEQTLGKLDKPSKQNSSKAGKDEKTTKEKAAKDKEQLRKEKQEREEKKERHREKIKRRMEMQEALQEGKYGSMYDSSKNKEKNKKFDKNESDRKRKYHKYDRKYDSFDKFRRQPDPPAAPSMF